MRFGRLKPGTPAAAAFEDSEVSLGAIGKLLWNHKRRIVVPTLLVTAAAFVVVNLLTPKYKSEARVLVEARENIFLRPEAEKSLTERNVVDQEAVTSQVQLVLSRDLARQVIAKLQLDRLPEFNSALTASSVTMLLRQVGLVRDPMSLTLEERVLAAYYERLAAYPVDKSRVIAIEFSSANSELAARAANAIAETYLTMQQVAKQDQARAAGQWLSGELERLRKRVADAEAKVEQFRAQSNLFVGANNTLLSNQQLTELNTQLSAARAQKADAETKARLIREMLRSGRPIESSDIMNSELIRRLSEQRVTLQAQLAEQSSTLLDGHPRIRELKAQIANLDQQIRNEADRLSRAFDADARIASARLDSIKANLDQLKQATASTSGQDVQLRELEREAKAQRDLFESYLAKYREATARDSIAAAPADARIISRAIVSNIPYFPKKIPIVLIAALATFVLCAALTVTGALLRSGFPRSAPVAAGSVGTVPDIVAHRVGETLGPAATAPPPQAAAPAPDHEPATATSEMPAPELQSPAPWAVGSVDDVAAALPRGGPDGRIIAVLGAVRDSGTTLSAIALARLLARDAKVLLVDLAFASPGVHVISADPSAPGMADFLGGRASFGDVIMLDASSPLHVIAAGCVEDGSSPFASPMLRAALAALGNSYDFVVLDVGVPAEAALEIIAQIAPTAVLTAPSALGSIDALARRLVEAGFSDVAVLVGPPPPLDYATTRTAAA